MCQWLNVAFTKIESVGDRKQRSSLGQQEKDAHSGSAGDAPATEIKLMSAPHQKVHTMISAEK